MSLGYTSRNPIIINVELTDADTWYQIASPVAGVRKWWIKANEETLNAFDFAFQENATAIWSNCGSGFVVDDCDLMNIWCRSATAGTIIEFLYFG